MTDIASSIYHGVQFKAEKRFSQGLAFMGTYTFSRNINTGGDGFNSSASPQDPTCIECDRALSAFHRKNLFAMNFIYELPFGKGKRYGADLVRGCQSYPGRMAVQRNHHGQLGTTAQCHASLGISPTSAPAPLARGLM